MKFSFEVFSNQTFFKGSFSLVLIALVGIFSIASCKEKVGLPIKKGQEKEIQNKTETQKPEIPHVGEEFSISTQTVEEEEPSIAWDGNHFLVVWQDKRNGSFDIYGTRITQGGKILDAEGILISNAPFDQIKPKVIWNGNYYLIVWQDNRRGKNWEILGARMNSSGKVLDQEGIPISVGENDRATPSLSWSGKGFLVVWEQKSNLSSGWDVWGTHLTSEGKIPNPKGFPISQAFGDQYYSGVSWNGKNFLVVWSDKRSSTSFDIYGTRVDPKGKLLDPKGFVISGEQGDQFYPSIAWNGNTHLVTWMDKREKEAKIYGARITSKGENLDKKGIPIGATPNFHALPFVASRGEEFLVIWDEERKVTFKDIFGARIDSDGKVLDPDLIAIYKGFERQTYASTASDGKRYLVVWKDYREGIPFQGDIYGRFIEFLPPNEKVSKTNISTDESRLGPYLIHQISIDVHNSKTLYAATSHYGILKSEDEGQNWRLINQGLRSFTHHQIVIHPLNSNIIFSGAWGGGISKSIDGGESWQEINEGLGNTAINKIVFHPEDSEMIYAVTESGVFRTTNSGETWAAFNKGIPHSFGESFQDLIIIPKRPNIFLLGSTKGLYRWNEKKGKWVQIRSVKGEEFTALAFHPEGPLILAGTRGSGILKSEDRGESWAKVKGIDSSWVTQIEIGLNDPRLIYATTVDRGFMMTEDGGNHWNQYNAGLPDTNIRSLAIDHMDPKTLYVGTYEDGIYFSKSGGQKWQPAKSIPRLTMIEILRSLPLDEDVRSPVDIQRLIDLGGEAGDVFGLGKAGNVPLEFVKCNGCHGWTDPSINLKNTYWRVPANKRDWKFTVKERMSKRANLTKKEETTIIQFLQKINGNLVKTHSLEDMPLPRSSPITPGPTIPPKKGSLEPPEKIVQRVCGQCHALMVNDQCVAGNCKGKKVFRTEGRQWTFVVDWMRSMGSKMNKEEQQVITEYLSKQFPAKPYPLDWEKAVTLPGHGWNITSLRAIGKSIFAGTEGSGKIFRSFDGRDWQEVNGSEEYRIYGILEFKEAFYAGADEPRAEIWKSLDGKHWKRVSVLPKDQSGVISLGSYKNYLYAGTSHGKLFRSFDGERWEEVAVLKQLSGPHWVRFIIEFKGMLYAGAEHGYIYRSSNGLDWKEIGQPLRGGREIFGIRAAEVFKGNLYVGSITHGEIWKSPDGVSWTLSFDATPGRDRGYVGSMVSYKGNLYAGIRTHSGFIFRTSGQGEWKEVGNISPYTIEAMAVFEDHLYAGTLIPPKAMIYRALEK